VRQRDVEAMSRYIPHERIFHSNAPTFFSAHPSREIATLDLWSRRIPRHLCSPEFFTRSVLSLSLSRFLLPFRSHRAYPLFRSKTETFLAFHTCFMGISRLGRKICKLNGINEKAEVPSFSFLSAHAGRRNALHYLNYPDLLSIPYEQRKTLSSESSRRENRANSC